MLKVHTEQKQTQARQGHSCQRLAGVDLQDGYQGSD
jgi:hypothetical protein